MARTDTLTNYLSDVAEAIKTKKGDDTPILASEFDTEIANLPSGGGGSSVDWNAIGYSSDPLFNQDGYNYALQVKENWDETSTNYSGKFRNDSNLVYMPLVPFNSSATTTYEMFSACKYLQSIPQLDTSNVTNMNNMFNGCSSLKIISLLDTSKVTNMSYMFDECGALAEIPQFNTKNVTKTNYMFNNCKALKTVPLLDFSSVTNINYMFANCYAIENLGGFKDLGKAYLTTAGANTGNYTLTITTSKLTHDSIMNVINNLYDIASAGVRQQTFEIGSTNMNKLTADEIAIATNKGWNVI